MRGGNKLVETALVETAEKPMVRCWLCQKPVEIKLSTKGKPYLVCDARNGGCGMQIFLREDKAVRLLQAKVKEEVKRGQKGVS